MDERLLPVPDPTTENKQTGSISRTELQNKWEQYSTQYFSISAATDEEEIRADNQLIEQFVKDQLAHKQGFKNIFYTAQGSIYFVLETGESLRVKQADQTGRRSIQPIFEKIIFIDQNKAHQYDQLRDAFEFPNNLINNAFTIHECQIGLVPIEFGVIGFEPIHYSEEANTFKITDDLLRSGAIHRGHEITEIIK